jgi:hypothetical protein
MFAVDPGSLCGKKKNGRCHRFVAAAATDSVDFHFSQRVAARRPIAEGGEKRVIHMPWIRKFVRRAMA